VTHFLRLSVDAGYRFVAGGKEVSPSDVRGFTLAFTTQFGWF
jgi:hypothetical protein